MKKGLIVGVIIGLSSAMIVSIGVGVSLGFYVKDATSGGSYGEVALRSYYERGDGSEENPFVITKPRHMYNFSRLHGLGVYDNGEYWFELGDKNRLVNGLPACYLGEDTSNPVPFLDMSASDMDFQTIYAIGSEALPFYGHFDGQNVEIKNMTVYADPEDAGLFGYTAHGSTVENLFLDNITIDTLGYTSTYAPLYSPESTIADGAYFTFDPCADDEETGEPLPTKRIDVSGSDYGSATFRAVSAENFTFDGVAPIPHITWHTPSSSDFLPAPIFSGDLVQLDPTTGDIVPNLENVFSRFRTAMEEDDPSPTYPLQASTSASLVAEMIDPYGMEHTKVVLTIEFIFSLDEGSTEISMLATLGNSHSNNIGLIIGHCDGSVNHCYVHDGHFVMNNGDSETHSTPGTYQPMANGSSTGLIGLIGNTVQNRAAEGAGASSTSGTSHGVLDFTTIYNDIVNDSTFDVPPTAVSPAGVVYHPNTSSKYASYFRKDSLGRYVTLENGAVSFKGQEIIHDDTDLGVFTIATDYSSPGTGGAASTALSSTVLYSEDLAIDDDENPATPGAYYLYYGTGEYNKTASTAKGLTFLEYTDSFNADQRKTMLLGEHLPRPGEVTAESFATRELLHNYYFRFKLEPAYRSNRGFYFSDVDKNSFGGSYLSSYFRYKICDEDGFSYPAGSKKSGVMLRDVRGNEIASLAASLATPDYSYDHSKSGIEFRPLMKTIGSDAGAPPGNMVNFEISTDWANVTVVAGREDNSRCAAVGIYKLEAVDYATYSGDQYINRLYYDPDYAFFMPRDNHLAYFDYEVNDSHIGQIGKRDSNGTLIEATHAYDEATRPALYNYGDEYGYASGKTRLFVHTFKLPRGRYVIGSATGKNRVNSGSYVQSEYGIAKLFYLCAQGQMEGQFDISNNVFEGTDQVENIDFVKTSRFTYNPGSRTTTTNINFDDYNGGVNPAALANQRAYIMLYLRDRSTFSAALSDLSMVYADGKFQITSTHLSAVNRIAVTNYAASAEGVPWITENNTVWLFKGQPGGSAGNGDLLKYPTE